MFRCPSCKAAAARLLIAENGIRCPGCYDARPRSYRGLLHQVRANRFGRLTEADAMRIKTNKKRADGEYRPDPRWRTSGD